LRETTNRPGSSLITRLVLQWFIHNGRDFPWRKTKNPYDIFIAEILLRRTQAERVVETYLQLIKRYPTPEHLAHADACELRQFFQPLGLIRRADLLIEAGKRILLDHKGLIPNDLCSLSTLPGMGIYSSRAIMCLAFGKPVPMIDESSGRLLRRVFGLHAIGPAFSDRELLRTAAAIVPVEHPREFNLGLLDIASIYCHHNVPACLKCPIRRVCSYRHHPRKCKLLRSECCISVFKGSLNH
jgi:A/G-specific adenine glycosylase